jgi:hypothetical protein
MAYYPEDPASPPPPVGHQVSTSTFLRDTMYLAAFVQAGPSMDAMLRTEPVSEQDFQILKLQRIFAAHQEPEIPRLLISVAATLRTKLDDGSWAAPSTIVGRMSKGTIHSVEFEPLPLRDACNKILHAQDVLPAPGQERSGPRHVTATVKLVGERGETPWVAEIYLRDFCIAVANIDFWARGGRPRNC